jgi:hypothetical protein
MKRCYPSTSFYAIFLAIIKLPQQIHEKIRKFTYKRQSVPPLYFFSKIWLLNSLTKKSKGKNQNHPLKKKWDNFFFR